MLKKIKAIGARLRRSKGVTSTDIRYTPAEVSNLIKEAYTVGYNDGKRDGLAIARVQATKSLQEIVWQQTQNK